MTLKQLEYFTAVAEEGTFQAASERLHVTQPPLSVQIKLLEEEIGAPLFLRGPRHAELTDAGRLLYSRASNLIELEKITEQEMRDYIAGNRGILRLGIASSTINNLLDQLILPFSKQYPGIRFELTEANTYHLLELLQSNLLDAALIRTPFQAGSSFHIYEVKKDRIITVGASGFFRADSVSGGLSLSSLDGIPLIVYRRWKEVLDDHFAGDHMSPFYYCIADDARTCLSMAERGLGVAIVPKSAVDARDLTRYRKQKVRMEQHPLVHPEITSSICLVTKEDGYVSIPLQRLISQLEHESTVVADTAFP